MSFKQSMKNKLRDFLISGESKKDEIDKIMDEPRVGRGGESMSITIVTPTEGGRYKDWNFREDSKEEKEESAKRRLRLKKFFELRD